MCSVTAVSIVAAVNTDNCLVPSDRAVFYEIISVNIIYISVSVIVIAVLGLLRVGPHVCGKVRMGVLHTFVKHCYHDPRVAGCKFPCISDIDIHSCDSLGGDSLVSVVDEAPLPEEVRVIEL